VVPSTKIEHSDKAHTEHLQAEIESLKVAFSDQEKEVAELREDVEATENERDFYFEKLRNIEVLLQDDGRDDDLSKAIFKILYATAEGFERADNDAEATEELSY